MYLSQWIYDFPNSYHVLCATKACQLASDSGIALDYLDIDSLLTSSIIYSQDRSTLVDLYNSYIGSEFGLNRRSDREIAERVIDALRSGSFLLLTEESYTAAWIRAEKLSEGFKQ